MHKVVKVFKDAVDTIKVPHSEESTLPLPEKVSKLLQEYNSLDKRDPWIIVDRKDGALLDVIMYEEVIEGSSGKPDKTIYRGKIFEKGKTVDIEHLSRTGSYPSLEQAAAEMARMLEKHIENAQGKGYTIKRKSK